MDRKIEAIYANRRKLAEMDLELRLKSINLNLPELAVIEKEFSCLYVELGKAKITGDKAGEKSAQEKIEILKGKKVALLELKKLDKDYFKPKYNCSNCNDTGYITKENGRKKCDCLRLEEAKLLYKNSNMLSRLTRENFDNFNFEIFDEKKEVDEVFSQRENMKDIVSNMKAYIKNFDNIDGKGLIFYGGVGLGKSFLCSCIGKELIDKGKTVLYYSTYDLIKILSKFTFEKSSYLADYPFDDYRKLDKVDLLIIDDLGAELTNSFVVSELFNMINSRIVKGKSTIISTNLDISELEDRYGERLFSRFLMYFSFFKFIGEDVRMKL